MSKRSYDRLLKLVLIGDSGVGKTSILLRYTDDDFQESYISTFGVDFRFRSIVIGDVRVKLQIWDTAGQEKFRTITSAYYRGADGIVVVYDVTSRESFNHVSHWVKDVKHSTPDVPIFIIGTQIDRPGRVVKTAEAVALAKSISAVAVQTSASTGEGIVEAFDEFSSICLEHSHKRVPDEKVRLIIGSTAQPKRRWCPWS